MAHQPNTGSKSTMRRTLMGGAIVSSLLIASLAPANASCLMNQQLNYNYQLNYQQSPPQTQATPRQGNGTSFGRSSGGAQLRWAPTTDFRLRARYGQFNNEWSFSQTTDRAQGSLDARGYRSPRFGSVVMPQAKNRYGARFGGMRNVGRESLQWGRNLNSFQPNANLATQVNRVDVAGFRIRGNTEIPYLNVRGERPANTRVNMRRDLILKVSPHYIE